MSGPHQPAAGSERFPSSSPQMRLTAAVAEVLAEGGYPALSVRRLIAHAGVSRATFYQYFADAQECFLAAYRSEGERLVRDVGKAATRPERELAVLDRLVQFARAEPVTARLLAREGLAAGPEGILERDGLIAQIALCLGRDDDSADRDVRLDLPATVLIGGVFRYLALRLSEEDPFSTGCEGVDQWARLFARGHGQRAWSRELVAPPPSGEPPPVPPKARATKPRGDRRQRLIRATAATIREKGYVEATVADIAAVADVSRRGFYDEFHSKADAYITSYEYTFQETLAACTPAFFGAPEWPERVWASALAFTGYLSREPLLAHLGLVECYAVGSTFVRRVHETHLAFTLFLEEGYRQSPEAELLSRECSALTMESIFEMAFQASRWNAALHMRRMQPLAVYVALAPFIGPDEAGEFVTKKLVASTADRACRAA
jgi:AcrR family transcriptional regulator